MSPYIEAKNICRPALLEFRENVDMYLPDTPGESDYLVEWDLDDCETVQRRINETIDVILSTCMANHVSYELHNIRRDYAEAIKNSDIRKCQSLRNKVILEFRKILIALKAIKE